MLLLQPTTGSLSYHQRRGLLKLKSWPHLVVKCSWIWWILHSSMAGVKENVTSHPLPHLARDRLTGKWDHAPLRDTLFTTCRTDPKITKQQPNNQGLQKQLACCSLKTTGIFRSVQAAMKLSGNNCPADRNWSSLPWSIKMSRWESG